MASRLVENVRLRWSAEPLTILDTPFLKVPDTGNVGRMALKYEYKAMLNGGEMIRVVMHDPFFTMINAPVGPEDISVPYFAQSRLKAPVNIKSRLMWASSSNELKTPWGNHALVGLAPYNEGGDNSGKYEFIAVDYASWHLNGGDAGGYRYKGNVKEVVTQICEKYSRGQLKCEFRTETKDSKENQWWQYRLDPKAAILSLLDWSPSINSQQTRWFAYPDDENGPGKIIFVEQADVPSIHRATYHWKGLERGKRGHGDIIDWEMIGDNAIQQVRHKIVTNGISAVSGAYYDRINPGTPGGPEKVVYVGDKQTPNKYNAKTGKKTAFTKPEGPERNPLDPTPGSVGWTTMPAIPEFSAGDLGIKYDDYMDGRARHWYLRLNNALMRCRFRIMGHHIWAGSEGLGVDTIDIVMHDAKQKGKSVKPHFLKGNWIVYGYHHQWSNEGASWITDLYCARLDHNAMAQKKGSASAQ